MRESGKCEKQDSGLFLHVCEQGLRNNLQYLQKQAMGFMKQHENGMVAFFFFVCEWVFEVLLPLTHDHFFWILGNHSETVVRY